jgi:hypothetical protein
MELHSSLEKYHRGLYKLACSPLFVLKDSASCNLLDIRQDNLSSETPYNFDHVYNPAASKTLIVYANILDEKFKQTNESIKRLSYELDFKYILRHTDLRNDSELDTIGGWGIEFLIKNMEYKPVEDFDILNQESLPDKDLSLETSYLLLDSIKQGEWKTANDLINNWPSNVEKFLKSNPSHKFHEEAIRNGLQYSLVISTQNSIENLLLINGHPSPSFLFFILPILRNELKSFDYLTNLGLSNSTATSILKHCNTKSHMYTPPGGIFAMSNSGRIFLNDLETDSYYKSWSRDPSSFLHSYQLAPVALNWLNLYLVVDLNSEISISAMNSLEMLYSYVFPVRMSLVVLGETQVANAFSTALKRLRKQEEGLVYDFFTLLEHPITVDTIQKAVHYLCPECSTEFDNEVVLTSVSVRYM